jgi:hypothetical protein
MGTNNAINLTAQGLAYYNGTNAFSTPTLTNFGVTYGTSTNDISSTAAGTTGTVLIGNTGAAPSFSNTVSSLTINTLTSTTATIGNLSVTTLNLTNPITVSEGGTGVTTFTPYGVVVAGSTTTAPLSDVDLTAGQVLVGTSTSPVAAYLTAGTGIAITTGQGSITITNTEAGSGGVLWFDEATSFTGVAGSGYFVSGVTTATLPASPVLGATVIIQDVDPTNRVSISTGTTVLIQIGNVHTTATTGYVQNTAQGDTLTLTYHDTDTTWYARGVQGNWSVN